MTSCWKRPGPCQGEAMPPAFPVLIWKLLQCAEEGTGFSRTPSCRACPPSSQAGGPQGCVGPEGAGGWGLGRDPSLWDSHVS